MCCCWPRFIAKFHFWNGNNNIHFSLNVIHRSSPVRDYGHLLYPRPSYSRYISCIIYQTKFCLLLYSKRWRLCIVRKLSGSWIKLTQQTKINNNKKKQPPTTKKNNEIKETKLLLDHTVLYILPAEWVFSGFVYWLLVMRNAGGWYSFSFPISSPPSLSLYIFPAADGCPTSSDPTH